MNRLSFLLGLLFLGTFSVKAQNTGSNVFTLEVDVTNMKPEPEIVILTYFNTLNGKIKSYVDSVGIRNGHGTFKGTISEPSFATLQTKYFGPDARFILSAHRIKIKMNNEISAISVTGSPFQKDFEFLMSNRQKANDESLVIVKKFNVAKANGDSVAALQYRSEMNAISIELGEQYKKYADLHAKTSALSVFALMQAANSGVTGIDSVYQKLAPSFKKLPSAVAIKEAIDKRNILVVGKKAPDFSMRDTAGILISTNSFRGKYLLIDFWASWCHPCRKESPYLIQAYQKYSNRNFQIISVSLDSKDAKNAWLKAIKDDKVGQWVHVASLEGFQSTVVKLYNISSIPQNFLLDPNGKIIAMNLRGNDLDKALDTIFK